MVNTKVFAGAFLLLLAAQSGQAALGPSVIADWFNVLQATVRLNGIQNQLSGRYYGLLGQSIYNALHANRLYDEKKAPVANETAVAALAAHTVLTHWFPWRFNVHDDLAKRQLGGLSKPVIAAARTYAEAAANKVIASRTRDGFATWSNFVPADNTTTYQWQFTPGQNAVNGVPYALYPQLGDVIPLSLSKNDLKKIADKYIKAGRAFAGSAKWVQDLEWVRNWGALNSTTRVTLYDQQSPAFWADGANTSAIGGHWVNITYQVLPANLPLYQQGKFYARFGAALSDASIAVFKVKYAVLHWRPVTAIRQGDGTGRYTADPAWSPLLNTPPHPSYPSGHQATSGAAYQVIRDFIGTDNVNVEIGSEGTPAFGTRTYTNLRAIADEVGYSRALGGVHYPTENEDGTQLGIEAAKKVIAKIK